jgi:hypothetical protein
MTEVLDAKMQDYGRERTTGFLLKDYYVVFAEPRTKGGDKPLHILMRRSTSAFRRAHCPPGATGGGRAAVCSRTVADENGKRVGGLIILRANSFEEAWDTL